MASNGAEALQRVEELKPEKYQLWGDFEPEKYQVRGDFEPFAATKTRDQATGRAAALRIFAR